LRNKGKKRKTRSMGARYSCLSRGRQNENTSIRGTRKGAHCAFFKASSPAAVGASVRRQRATPHNAGAWAAAGGGGGGGAVGGPCCLIHFFFSKCFSPPPPPQGGGGAPPLARVPFVSPTGVFSNFEAADEQPADLPALGLTPKSRPQAASLTGRFNGRPGAPPQRGFGRGTKPRGGTGGPAEGPPQQGGAKGGFRLLASQKMGEWGKPTGSKSAKKKFGGTVVKTTLGGGQSASGAGGWVFPSQSTAVHGGPPGRRTFTPRPALSGEKKNKKKKLPQGGGGGGGGQGRGTNVSGARGGLRRADSGGERRFRQGCAGRNKAALVTQGFVGGGLGWMRAREPIFHNETKKKKKKNTKAVGRTRSTAIRLVLRIERKNPVDKVFDKIQ